MLQGVVRIETSGDVRRRSRCHTFEILRHEASRMHYVVMLAVALFVSSSAFEVNDDSAPELAVVVPPHPSVASLESLGRKLFFDRTLSASHSLSCASCHDPAHAYGPPNAKAVQLGGKSGRVQGQRAVPSLRYLQS